MALSVSAVLVAAGSSTRMGTPKQWLPLCGKPVLAHTLAAFDACPAITEIVVVMRPEDEAPVAALLQALHTPAKAVVGSTTRCRSVAKGVAACETGADYVAIHDGARPLITPALIARTVEDAVAHGAAAAAVPVKDTLKFITPEGYIEATPDRSRLWAVQTPQVFPKAQYEAALAQEQVDDVTDDCQLFERLGLPVYLTKGDYANLKITTPEDLAVAKELLQR